MELNLEKLAEYIKDMTFTMMTTVDTDGSIHSRPMATLKIDAKNFDGTLWFFTKKNSPKVYNIEQDQHVNLTYSKPDKQTYVSITGTALLSTDKDRMKELWNPMFKAWFPEGLEDPEISLIGVQIQQAEVWDAPPGKVVQLIGFLKAIVTGRPYGQDKEHTGHLEVNH